MDGHIQPPTSSPYLNLTKKTYSYPISQKPNIPQKTNTRQHPFPPLTHTPIRYTLTPPITSQTLYSTTHKFTFWQRPTLQHLTTITSSGHHNHYIYTRIFNTQRHKTYTQTAISTETQTQTHQTHPFFGPAQEPYLTFKKNSNKNLTSHSQPRGITAQKWASPDLHTPHISCSFTRVQPQTNARITAR